jgi:acetoin utilization deacetylase AcuC-like enzyme
MLKIAWSKEYSHPLPEGHRFPMVKYELIPQQLIYEGTISESNLFSPRSIDPFFVELTHDPIYYEKLKKGTLSLSEIRRTGFPYSSSLVLREEIIVQGTLQTADHALEHGISMNVAGGTHHAYRNRGEGFCLLNDIAIATNYLIYSKKCDKVLIVDLDVHQGNGTAEIFSNNEQVFTFSMHGKNNYPFHKEKSDLDIELPDHITDKDYLRILEENLPLIIDEVEPGFIFFQSGVDVLATDKLGKLSLSREGCKLRDRFVLSTCKKNHIPVSISMGGGYSERISDIVEAHCNTFRLAQELFF